MAITCTILLLIDLGENWPLLYQFPGRAATEGLPISGQPQQHGIWSQAGWNDHRLGLAYTYTPGHDLRVSNRFSFTPGNPFAYPGIKHQIMSISD